MMARGLPGEVVHHELVAGLLQVGGHLAAHHAEADETDQCVLCHCFPHSLFLPSTTTV